MHHLSEGHTKLEIWAQIILTGMSKMEIWRGSHISDTLKSMKRELSGTFGSCSEQ